MYLPLFVICLLVVVSGWLNDDLPSWVKLTLGGAYLATWGVFIILNWGLDDFSWAELTTGLLQVVLAVITVIVSSFASFPRRA
jgi:hypothetical protein